MSSHTSAPSCASYSHSGYLFERQRTAMRQNAFARARGVASAATKRKNRSDDDSDDSSSSSGSEQPVSWDHQLPPQHHHHQPKRRRVLEGLKRMRVSSPPSDAHTTSANRTHTSSIEDSAMEDDDTRALVRIRSKWDACLPTMPTKWASVVGARAFATHDLQMPPTDPSCTAIVLFTAPPSAVPRSLLPSPRVELVESDEDEGATDSSSSDGEQPFVRFEEIHDDDDDDDENEPMEID